MDLVSSNPEFLNKLHGVKIELARAVSPGWAIAYISFAFSFFLSALGIMALIRSKRVAERIKDLPWSA